MDSNTIVRSLSNEIPVVYYNYDAPVAALYWWVNTGSADELRNEEGFAHFLEHMHFKDTDAKKSGRASQGELASLVESHGGDINAYTSFDQTVYHVTCASLHFEKIVSSFTKMAKPQSFLKLDFDREKEVILEELRKTKDAPSRAFFQKLFESTYATHPYGRPVIGYEKTLKAAKVADLQRFYARQYVANRMGVVVVAPMNVARVKTIHRLLEAQFGKIKRVKNADSVRKQEKQLHPHLRGEVFGFQVQSPNLGMSFRVPDLAHPDIPAIDVLGCVLAQGETSRLYQNLFFNKKCVTNISGGLYVPKDPGMLYVSADYLEISETERVIHEIVDQFLSVKENPPTAEELQRVVTTHESQKHYASQSADAIAGRLAHAYFQMNDPAADDRYLMSLKALTSDHVKEVTAEYLVPERASWVLMRPEANRQLDNKIQKVISHEFSRLNPKPKVKQKVVKTGTSGPEIWKLPSGLTVAHQYRPQSSLFNVQSIVKGGSRTEIRPGVSGMMSQLWTMGTQTKDHIEIARRVENRAGSLDGFSGRNTFGMQVGGLAKDFDELTGIFKECFFEPTFPEEHLELLKKVAIDSIKSIDDHSASKCSFLFLKTLYEDHPYGRLLTGDIPSIESANRDLIQRQYRAGMKPANLVLSMVGKITRAQAEQIANDFEKEFKVSKESLVEPNAPAALKAPRWVTQSKGREQEHLLHGGFGIQINDKARIPLQVMSAILGGQSGRLFIELREKKSLAYTVAPTQAEGVDLGHYAIYIGCSPSKRDEALDGIQRVLENLVNKPIAVKELKRAQEYLLGQRTLDMQSDASLASDYAVKTIYGLPILTQEQAAIELRKVTAKDIQMICKKIFLDSSLVTSIVG